MITLAYQTEGPGTGVRTVNEKLDSRMSEAEALMYAARVLEQHAAWLVEVRLYRDKTLLMNYKKGGLA